MVIHEEIRSQNRATLEAIGALRLALERRLDTMSAGMRDRTTSFELALRDLGVSVEQHSLDRRELTDKIDPHSA